MSANNNRHVPRRDSSGRTFREFARELFEWEDCDECGRGARNHVPALTPFGLWFARCVTPVVFRKWKKKEGGQVLALFPTIKENDGLVCSYQHIGQHGSADYIHVIAATKPAKLREYEALRHELESPPYNYKLKVCKRYPIARRVA